MKIDTVTECDKNRIPLAQGEADGKQFTLSIFLDGTGCILEFKDIKYILRTEEILKQILEDKE